MINCENMKIMRLSLAAALVTVAVSCIGKFDEYNHNPNEITNEEMERDNYNVGAKLLQLQNSVIPTEEHLNQFTEILAGMAFGGYSEATKSDWATKFSTFNPSADWLKAPFVDVMTDTYAPYRGILAATDDPVPLALANILRVAIMHRLTDQYGPIPYSQVVENRENALTVAYDSQEDVYTRMFAELDDAIRVLDENSSLPSSAFAEYDLVYGGNLQKWIRYANSLKLRMAMRLTEVAPETARAKAAEAVSGGVIETNADNAEFRPVVNRVTSICWATWQDHIISADLDSYMNGYSDPRMEKMFTLKQVTESVLNPSTGKYESVTRNRIRGMRIGTTAQEKEQAVSAASFPIFSDTEPFLWINAAEVAFLKAEWQLRWGTMAEAGALYRKGVQLSFEEHGAGDAAAYLSTEATPAGFSSVVEVTSAEASFPAQSTITPVWNDNDGFETALERIITQKWIAIFPLGNEAWAEYRRTGYPKLAPCPDDCNRSGGTVNPAYGARRLPYPAEEYAENRANVTEAVASKLGGGDNFATRVWWDVKPLK